MDDVATMVMSVVAAGRDCVRVAAVVVGGRGNPVNDWNGPPLCLKIPVRMFNAAISIHVSIEHFEPQFSI